MHIVSTSTQTIVSKFQTLETESIYVHGNQEETDFQFLSKNGVFVEINLKSGLEVMRVKPKDNKMHLQKIRKLAVEALTSVGCAKQSSNEIAIGMANGCISLYNIDSTKNLHRFKSDAGRSAVSFLDYNLSDEYLAAVYESGLINIFGLSTKTKLESLNIDSNSLLARFHPTKRFLLGIASNKGSVSVYDTQSKKKTFHVPNKHSAPCRDLCFASQNPHTFVSVGYDCIANVFDTRRRIEVAKYKARYPLSSVSLSECSTLLCLGNLKGELCTMDMRNLKSPLAVKKVHEAPVRRVHFVPKSKLATIQNTATSRYSVAAANVSQTGIDMSTSGVAAAQQAQKGHNSPLPKLAGPRDSLFDFLDPLKVSDPLSVSRDNKRDSFDWLSLGLDNEEAKEEGAGSAQASDPGTDKLSNKDNEDVSTLNSIANNWSPVSNLTAEFSSDQIAMGKASKKLANRLASDDKENIPARLSQDLALPQLSDKNSSTPLAAISDHVKNSSYKKHEVAVNTATSQQPPPPPEAAIPAAADTPAAAGPAVAVASATVSEEMKVYLAEQMNSLRLEVAGKVDELKGSLRLLLGEVNYTAEDNKWEILSQTAHLSIKQMDALEKLEQDVQLLLQSDPFVREMNRLRAENEHLKSIISSMTQN